MPKITVNRSGGGGAKWRVLVDDDHHHLNFKGNTAEMEVAPGNHVLIWTLIGGQPGAAYDISLGGAVSGPFQHSSLLDDDGEAVGQRGFKA